MYEIVIDTGTWQAREARVTGRGVSVSISGTRATIRLRPAAASWNPALAACTGGGACGDATTRATEDLSGRAEGVLSDLRAAVPPGGAAVRAGFWQASNAQYTGAAVFDTATRAFTVRLGNPHLRLDGRPATGAYEAFLPNAVLPSYLGVAAAADVDPGSLVVTRTDGTRTTLVAAPVITRVTTGVELRIAGIGYSTATYRVYGVSRALPGEGPVTRRPPALGRARAPQLEGAGPQRRDAGDDLSRALRHERRDRPRADRDHPRPGGRDLLDPAALRGGLRTGRAEARLSRRQTWNRVIAARCCSRSSWSTTPSPVSGAMQSTPTLPRCTLSDTSSAARPASAIG